ncbi:hypothetical protein BJ912DRAFT_66385 [Pholiota molesta]|nr:hypothetical protein BJ912DRAFT_66385 [Pholiota molesta]
MVVAPERFASPHQISRGDCMCSFCRRCSGSEIQSWAYIPLANILKPDSTTPICLEVEDERPAGLRQFIASPGNYKESCGTCGATAFRGRRARLIWYMFLWGCWTRRFLGRGRRTGLSGTGSA